VFRCYYVVSSKLPDSNKNETMKCKVIYQKVVRFGCSWSRCKFNFVM